MYLPQPSGARIHELVRQVGYVEYACYFLPPAGHLASGIGASRNAVIIEISQSARSTSVT
jgi:hypothetical protein